MLASFNFFNFSEFSVLIFFIITRVKEKYSKTSEFLMLHIPRQSEEELTSEEGWWRGRQSRGWGRPGDWTELDWAAARRETTSGWTQTLQAPIVVTHSSFAGVREANLQILLLWENSEFIYCLSVNNSILY